MVDLPASEIAMRPKKKQRKHIEPDAFHLARRKAGLTVAAAALELDVDVRTIRNYENGVSRIPYPAFRILRLLANYQLVGKGWEDWGFWQNKLWTPEGRSFESYELRYLAIFISIARHHLKTRKATQEEQNAYGAVKVIEMREAALEREQASCATAQAGARPAHVSSVEIERPQSLQEKAA